MSTFSSPYDKIDYGKDYNFFRKLTITSGTFQDACDIIIPFMTQTITFQLESGTGVEYSMNGSTLHGDMLSGKASANLIFENRQMCKVWFRGSGVIRIEAWAQK